MNNLFSYYEGSLDAFIADAMNTKDCLIKRVIANASECLVEDLKDFGIVIDTTYKHTLDNSAIRHTLKSHGSTKEELRGQDVIIYTKTMADGVTFYVEEIRLGRHELAASTLYKRKKENSPTQMD